MVIIGIAVHKLGHMQVGLYRPSTISAPDNDRPPVVLDEDFESDLRTLAGRASNEPIYASEPRAGAPAALASRLNLG